VPEEVIRDYYLPHFRAAIVEGGAGSIMCAYNRVNGVPSCASPWLLETVLRKEWGFGGFVVSDCGAIGAMVWGHKVKPADEDAVVAGLSAGCDLECGKAYSERIASAVARGVLPEANVDRALSRVLAARFRLGMFDPPEKNPYASITKSVVDGPEHRALALEATRQALVLLKNDGVLPLDPKKTKKLAVIGPAANVFLHGSSGYHGTNNHLVTPRDGIARRAGTATIVSFVAGTVMPSGEGFPMTPVPESLLRTPDGKPGLRGDYFSNRTLTGAPALSRVDAKLDFAWGNGSPAPGLASDDFSVRWTGKLVPNASGNYVLQIKGDDGYRLSLDGKVIVEDWTDHGSRARGIVMALEAGRSYDLLLEFYEHGGGADLRFSYAFVQSGASDAVKAAREADAAIFFAAVDPLAADEEKDFPSLALPDDQSKLLDAVLKANPKTVLVLQSGNPLALTPREKSAPAILQAWYAGQDTGTAIAEVLFGDVNPSGKLPITFYASAADLPPMEDYDVRKGRTYMYLEKAPAFPFGHGLSFTRYDYANLVVSPSSVTQNGTLRIEFDLANTGARPGAEVAQAYVRPPRGPKKVLRAFRRVALDAGKKTHVTIDLAVNDLAHHDAAAGRAVVDPGSYELMLGASSSDIRQRAKFDVKAP
jgi:beta-glucosidase